VKWIDGEKKATGMARIHSPILAGK